MVIMEDEIELSRKSTKRLFRDLINHINKFLDGKDGQIKSTTFDIMAKKYAISIIVALRVRLDISDKDIDWEDPFKYVMEKLLTPGLGSIGDI